MYRKMATHSIVGETMVNHFLFHSETVYLEQPLRSITVGSFLTAHTSPGNTPHPPPPTPNTLVLQYFDFLIISIFYNFIFINILIFDVLIFNDGGDILESSWLAEVEKMEKMHH